ncbi:MAG: MBL fold metallo-hydrolase [Clostridia bacterium]|nr:MBL fold metallo-hydrolase [Clostridia bacterium]
MKIQKRNKFLAILLGIVAAISFAMVGLTTMSTKADMVEYETGKVEIYQIAPDAETLTQGYVIKTVNNKIIVIDGGVGDYDKDTYLTHAIRAILGLNEGEAFHVDAWFLSHPHNDHIFELAKMLNGYVDENDESVVDGKVAIDVPKSLTDGTPQATTYVTPDNNFTIGKFYFDFPTWNYKSGDTSPCLKNLKDGLEVYAKAHPEVEDFQLTNNAIDVYSELNGKYINKDTIAEGQNIYIDGVRFEILQTWSYSDGDANNNSMIMRMWVDGQSVMFFNDAGRNASARLMNTYGAEFLKADIVNMAHHGQNGVSQEMYEAVGAKVRLWASNNYVWNDTGVDALLETTDVRTWIFGSPDKFTKNTATDLVACLSTFPTEISDQSAWTKEVLDSMKISIPYVVAFKDDAGFKMNEGASVRLNEGTGNAGLRFSARMSAYDDSASYGFVIAPREYFDAYTENYAQNLIANSGTKAIIDLRCKMLDGAVRKTGNFYEIQGSISMIKYANMNREFTGLAYKLKDGVYTDAEFTSLDDITRSVLDVALKANASGDFDGADNAEDLAIIKSFIHKGVMSEQGVSETDYDANATIDVNLAFKETSASVEYGDSVIAEIETDVDAGLVTYSYDKKLIDFDPETGKITPLVLGTATLTASCYDKTATFTVTTATKEGYYLTFENEGAIKDVMLNDRAYRTGKAIETELVTNVTDKIGVTEPNAVKITTTASGGGICDLVIDLPKDVDVENDKGVTVAINFAETEGTFAIFQVHYWEMTNPETGRPILGAKDPVSYSGKGTRPFINATERDAALNTWKYIYVDYTTCETDFDKVVLAMSGIPANGKSVIYVAYVAEGDVSAEKTAAAQEQLMGQLKESLTDGYIAQFDNGLYADLVSTVNSGYYWENSSLKAEILDEFEGETGVLKVTGIANTSNNQGWFKIRLPKPHSGSYTVRSYFATTDRVALNSIFGGVSGTTGSYDKVLTTSQYLDQWADHYVTTSGDTNYLFFAVANTGGAQVEVYFSFVYDGQKLNLSTPEGYLATYDNADWINTITQPSGSYYYEGGITTEYLESFQGETGVVKVTGQVNGVNGSGWLKLDLPKAHSGKFTIRFWIAETEKNPGLIGFLEDTSGTRVTGCYWFSDNVPANGVWHTKVVTTSTDTSAVYFEAGNGQNAYLEVYFAFIMDGDIADVAKEITAETLGDGEVANFDNAFYADLLSIPSTHPAKSCTAEILSSVELGGETRTNVLKLTVNLSSSVNWSFVNLKLPKAHSGVFTIEYYIKSETFPTGVNDAVGIKDAAGNLLSHDFEKFDAWTKQTFTAKESDTTYDAIGIGMVNHTLGATLEIYIDCVYDGTVA